MKSCKTILLINGASNAGNSLKKWNQVKDKILKSFEEDVLIQVYDPPFDVSRFILQNYDEKYLFVVVGGGDGTLNFVANCLYDLQRKFILENFCLGSIGLGSSNDFYKPCSKKISSIPIRIDRSLSALLDIGKVRVTNKNGEQFEKIFLVNGSLGVTSKANSHFNNPDPILSKIKKLQTNLAIVLTALKTIISYRNIPVTIKVNQEPHYENISNLSIALIPYISGSFHFRKQRSKNGVFDVFLCRDLSRYELIMTLISLSVGKFKLGKKRDHYQVDQLMVESEIEIPLEIDGEIFQGKIFEFQLLSESLCFAN